MHAWVRGGVVAVSIPKWACRFGQMVQEDTVELNCPHDLLGTCMILASESDDLECLGKYWTSQMIALLATHGTFWVILHVF